MEAGIKQESIDKLAEGAIKAQQLLKNNSRKIVIEDAIAICKLVF